MVGMDLGIVHLIGFVAVACRIVIGDVGVWLVEERGALRFEVLVGGRKTDCLFGCARASRRSRRLGMGEVGREGWVVWFRYGRLGG